MTNLFEVPKKIKYIEKENDFPNPDGGVIPVESDVLYIVCGGIYISNPLFFAEGINVSFINGSGFSALIYTGTGAFLRGVNTGNIGIFTTAFVTIDANSSLFDISGIYSATSYLFFINAAFDTPNFGRIHDTGFYFLTNAMSGWHTGLDLKNNSIIGIINITVSGSLNQSGSLFSLSGTIPLMTFGNIVAILGATETFFSVDEGLITFGGGFNNLNLVGSTKFWDPLGLDQSFLPFKVSGCVGSPDSTQTAKLSITNNALVTIISTVSTPTPINALWKDGQIEERFVFQDIVTFDNTTNKLTTTFSHGLNAVKITASTIAFVDSNPDTITDSGSGFLTAGFKAYDKITVTGSTLNDGVYTIQTVTAGTITLIETDTLAAEGAGATITITKQDVVTLFTYTGTLPTGLSAINYYVISDTATTFYLAATRGGAIVPFTDNGTGTNYYRHVTGNNLGVVIHTSLSKSRIHTSGWLFIKGALGTVVTARIVLMKISITGIVSLYEYGSKVNVSTSTGASSIIDSIVDLDTGEGVVIYIINDTSATNLVAIDSVINHAKS